MRDQPSRGRRRVWGLANFCLTCSSYLALAALAAKRGITTNARGEISNNAAFGTIESAETIAFFVTLVTWPASLAALAWILATLCVVTTVACVGVDAMVVKARPTS